MELRSHRQKKDANEYAELKITLSGLGFYEENMELTEMRQILQALQMSESDCEKGKHENKFEFVNIDNVFNSTMINPCPQGIIDSPSNSPEPHFEILTVQALVHHPLNWSPTRGDGVGGCEKEDLAISFLTRKRNSEESNSTASKRLCLNSIESAPDSGISVSNATSSNASPVSELNWDGSSFDVAAHSSTKTQTELSGTFEESLAFTPYTNCFATDEEK